MSTRTIALGLAFSMTAGITEAQSCSTLLKALAPARNAQIAVSLITMNNQGIASFVGTTLTYVSSIPGPSGAALTSRWLTRSIRPTEIEGADDSRAVQVFSDRTDGAGQKFLKSRADDLGIEILDASPTVILTLKSWNNGRVTFKPVCDGDGFMRGDTPEVKYYLYLKK